MPVTRIKSVTTEIEDDSNSVITGEHSIRESDTCESMTSFDDSDIKSFCNASIINIR